MGGGRSEGATEKENSTRQSLGEATRLTDLQPGHWFVLDEVQELRERLLSQGIVPKNTLKDTSRN